MRSNAREIASAKSNVLDRRELVSRLQKVALAPELAESTCEVTREEYVDVGYFESEIDVLFRNYPSYVCLSAEIPDAGDYKTLTIVGVPIFVIRGEDGVARGFRNTCSHRGAPVLTAPRGSGAEKMICAYHGWTYDAFGKLVGLPLSSAFPGLNKEANGLRPMRIQEKYGLIFTVIDNDAPAFDIDEHLGELGCQFDSLGVSNLKPDAEGSIVTPTNWKLAWETFGESYHVTSLHPRLASMIVGNGLIYDSFGPHGRITLPLLGLKDLLAQPEANWANAESGVHILFHYLLFPNLIITLMDGAMQVQQLMPGKHVGEVVTTQTQAFLPSLPDEKRASYEGFFNFSLYDLTANEDYPMAIGIYNSLVADSLDKTTFGRCEWPLHLFHHERRRLMREAAR